MCALPLMHIVRERVSEAFAEFIALEEVILACEMFVSCLPFSLNIFFAAGKCYQ